MKKITQVLFAVLFTAPTLLIAQALVAKFSVSDTAICVPATVSFTDLSTNHPTSWKWYFPGGTPDTSTLQNPPPVSYGLSGYHSVKLVVENGSGIDSVTITNCIHVYSPPHVYFTGPADLCQYSQGTITAYGGTEYHWSTGETTSSINIPGVVSTTYTVQVANGPCIKDTSFTVHVDTSMEVNIIGDTSICLGDTGIIYASPGKGYSYMWSNGSTTDSVILYDGGTPGLIIYYLTVTNGACSEDSIKITVDYHICPNGVENYSDLTNIDIYPNPANSFLSITIENPVTQPTYLSILDITGRTLISEKANLSQSQLNIDVSSLSPGIYFIKFQTDEGILVRKFVKE